MLKSKKSIQLVEKIENIFSAEERAIDTAKKGRFLERVFSL